MASRANKISDNLRRLFQYRIKGHEPSDHQLEFKDESRQLYQKVSGEHPQMLEFYGNLFGIKLSKPDILFGGWPLGSYDPVLDRICLSIYNMYLLEFRINGDQPYECGIDILSEEEGHRFLHHANRYSQYSRRFKHDRYKNEWRIWNVFNEGVVWFAMFLYYQEFRHEELAKVYSPKPYLHANASYYGNNQKVNIEPDHVMSFLAENGQIRDFALLEQSEALGRVYPHVHNIKDAEVSVTLRYLKA